jgi:hypothetical protein
MKVPCIFFAIIGKTPKGYRWEDLQVMRLVGESDADLKSRAEREARAVHTGRSAIIFRSIS